MTDDYGLRTIYTESDSLMNVLETERLFVRQLAAEDDAFILELLNQPSFIKNIADRGVRTLEDARAYIANGPAASYERNGFGLWLVGLKESNTPIGMCGLIRREQLEDVDIGYALLERFWGKGYAQEMAAGVLAYGRDTVGLKRVVAIVSPDNDDSVRVLEKIGLHYEGLRQVFPDDIELKFFGINF